MDFLQVLTENDKAKRRMQRLISKKVNPDYLNTTGTEKLNKVKNRNRQSYEA